MPEHCRLLVVWFAVTFRAFLSKHCGKISHFRLSIVSSWCRQPYFGRKSSKTWPSLSLRARKATKERKLIIRPTLATAEWVKCIKFYYEFTEASSLEGRHFGCDSRSGEGTHVLCPINSWLNLSWRARSNYWTSQRSWAYRKNLIEFWIRWMQRLFKELTDWFPVHSLQVHVTFVRRLLLFKVLSLQVRDCQSHGFKAKF